MELQHAAPRPTRLAHEWLRSTPPNVEQVKRALLSNIDGHRSVIELESFARAMGLGYDALGRLRAQGLIELPADGAAT